MLERDVKLEHKRRERHIMDIEAANDCVYKLSKEKNAIQRDIDNLNKEKDVISKKLASIKKDATLWAQGRAFKFAYGSKFDSSKKITVETVDKDPDRNVSKSPNYEALKITIKNLCNENAVLKRELSKVTSNLMHVMLSHPARTEE